MWGLLFKLLMDHITNFACTQSHVTRLLTNKCSWLPAFSPTSPCYSPQSSSFSELLWDPSTSPPLFQPCITKMWGLLFELLMDHITNFTCTQSHIIRLLTNKSSGLPYNTLFLTYNTLLQPIVHILQWIAVTNQLAPPSLSALHHQDMSSAFWVSNGPFHQLHLHSISHHQVMRNLIVLWRSPTMVWRNPIVLWRNPTVVWRNPTGVWRNLTGVWRYPILLWRNPTMVLRNPTVVWGNPIMVWRNPTVVWRNPTVVWRNPILLWRNPTGVWRNPIMVWRYSILLWRNPSVVWRIPIIVWKSLSFSGDFQMLNLHSRSPYLHCRFFMSLMYTVFMFSKGKLFSFRYTDSHDSIGFFFFYTIYTFNTVSICLFTGNWSV